MSLDQEFPIRLKDGRCGSISRIVEADAEAVLDFVESISGESDFLSFGPGEFGLSLEQERAFIREFADPAKGLMLKATVAGDLVGMTLLVRVLRPRVRHVGKLALSVRRPFWGCGIGRALCLATFAAGKEIGVTRVALEVRADNARAIALYEKLGFRHEGRLVGAFVVGGIPYDELTMGLPVE